MSKPAWSHVLALITRNFKKALIVSCRENLSPDYKYLRAMQILHKLGFPSCL